MRALGVAVEASYTIGEYDILILSARESDGLETWLLENGYRIPKGASKALKPYIRQNMKFFVAKVNLKEQARTGLAYLRPLQFAFESEKFMLPLRLGMVNANGPQDLIAYVLTRNGRVESTNYRTVKLPANVELPFTSAATSPGSIAPCSSTRRWCRSYRVVFTEYFWDMSWCDPCAADPLSARRVARGRRVLARRRGGCAERPGFRRRDAQACSRRAAPVMLTRLHVRYTPQTFPEDLMFQETSDRDNFQARYVLRHAWPASPMRARRPSCTSSSVASGREGSADPRGADGLGYRRGRSRMDLQPVAQAGDRWETDL